VIITASVVVIFAAITIQRNFDWRSEEQLYTRTLQWQPETANLSTSLGEIYLRKGDNARAHEFFTASLGFLDDPRFASIPYESYRVYLGLGIAEARESKVVEAVDHLQKALDIYPEGDGAYATLGGVLVSQGQDYPGAMALLEKAMQLSAVNELARDYMGVALVNQGQYEQAVKYFREALQINPDLESAKQHLEIALQAVRR
jgi:tetratricopeptide (TPR) repeat protein